MQLPVYEDVVAAGQFIRPHLPPTPLVSCWGLSQLLDCQYHFKAENFQPTGAFKVRGGVNLVGHLSPQEKRVGVISASTGNHGQSLAFAGGIFNVPVLIYGPAKNPNTAKVEAMRRLGAEVRLYGADFDEAREEVERVARTEGRRYVHSADEPRLIAGVGTMGLEIFESLPDVEVIIVPVGAGSGVCGNGLVAKRRNPNVQVIGVQAEGAPACHRVWHGQAVGQDVPMDTRHEGLATRVPFELPTRLMKELLDDFVLVSDAEIDRAIRLLAQHGRIVAEGAGAASLAAAVKLRDRLQGKKVVGVVSGGNLALERYAGVLMAGG
ncbi:MAG: pyridoxal-phosphate dependent enzyme [Candidatus Latescibacteria bacterium]|nr:pyridoxal-phosphate dependent enzyme [Candidatus Latescibacterota bacterium]